MRTLRSTVFWVVLIVVAAELYVFVAFFVRDVRLPLAAQSTPAAALDRNSLRANRVVVADATAFHYQGRWERVAGKRDGRVSGRSSRTFVKGARATLAFSGRFVRLYGVLGPGGGFGAVQLDGGPATIVDFFAPSKAAHRLVYASRRLPSGPHRMSIVVVADPTIARARAQYVNIDGAEYGS